MTVPVIAAAPITLRHIKHSTGAGAVTVLGATLVAQSKAGINGTRGYQSGSYEQVLSDEGKASIVLPNTVGEDGVLHRRRFLIFTDEDYHPGDEWVEIWEAKRLLHVGTPIDGEKRRGTVTLELADALWMANTQRETAAGFWAHAPRDVFEYYTRAWQQLIADDFETGADPALWTKTAATDQTGFVRIAPAAAGAGDLAPTAAWPTLQPATARSWRLEVSHQLTLAASGQAIFSMEGTDGGYARLMIAMSSGGVEYAQMDVLDDASGFVDQQQVTLPKRTTGLSSVAIECRDRWLLFYIGGQLVHCIEANLANAGINYSPYIFLNNGAGGGTVLDVHAILLRAANPFLMRGADKGERRIPGLLPSGGLQAAYFDDADLRAYADGAEYFRRVLAPTRSPYARRQDPDINHPVATPPAWQAPTPPNGECFSVRWTGAIYLDLAANDVNLQLRNLDEGGRVWVGKTLYGEALIDSWISAGSRTVTSGGLRAHLGASVSGWYPIRVDFAQGLGAGGIILEWKTTPAGSYVVIPSTSLSPYGVYEAEVRYDSHAEQLKAIALAYGLQYRCEPRSLESGLFPGEVVPRIRVGRDTDKILTPDESTDVGVAVSAGDVIDTLLGDASGLGDQANAAQLTNEAIHYLGVRPDIAADRHMAVLSGFESLADITDPILLRTRMGSLLGLRTAPWEEISARPRGHRELRGAFQLPTSIAAFAWEPGDGLRVHDDALDLDDETPRQIIAASWPFVPDGLACPSVRFRQRPRTQQDALRALIRAVLLPQRNYQGQLAVLNGSWSQFNSGYSVVALPANLADVVRCELVIALKSDASTWTVRDHPGATALTTFNTSGRVDLLPNLVRRPDGYAGVSQQFIVRVTGGTGSAEAILELLVRV